MRVTSQPVWEAEQVSILNLCLPNSSFDLFNSSFCGVPIAQHWADLALWETFLNDHSEIEMIVEIGTWCGGMSLFLLMQCLQRDMKFQTFDAVKHSCLSVPLAETLRLTRHFCQGDVFGDVLLDLKTLLSSKAIKVLFCDGGDKPQEFRTFVPHLRPGDFVVVHDYGVEFVDTDIESTPVQVRSVLIDKNVPSLTGFWQVL